MENNVQVIISAIQSRTSSPRLKEPAPNEDQLNTIFRCALRSPDHLVQRPWRYLVVKGDARQKLGRLFRDAALSDDPEVNVNLQQKYENMPLRAPLIVVGIASPQHHPKVPEVEEQVSCGVGMGYMLLAADALGFGGMWRTGPLAYHPLVKKGLGLEPEESIIGFLYLGTPEGSKKSLPTLQVADFVSQWHGPT